MSSRNYKTIKQKLDEVTQSWVSNYIIWKFSNPNDRPSFEEFSKCDKNIKSEKACENWLTREDAQKAIQIYMKHTKIYNLMKIYYTMLDKSLKGDVNAAKWVENFSNSSFFDESTDEMNDFLSGIDIPALKKGGAKNGNK